MTDSLTTSCDSVMLVVDVQYAQEENDGEEPPSAELIQNWAQSAFSALGIEQGSPTEVTIRIVDKAEIQDMNRQYRGKDKATNVLSFPYDNEFSNIAELEVGLLGDIVVCHGVLLEEAQQQGKQLQHHYAHMVTHGVLHLNGYEHENDHEANNMEALETKILVTQGVPDPYSTA